MTYYKGNLELISSIKDKEIMIGYIIYGRYKKKRRELICHNIYNQLKIYVEESMTLFCNREIQKCSNKEILKTLNEIFENNAIKLENSLMFEIIYEIIYDQNGHQYGKELITGLTFPLITNKIYTKNFYDYIDFNIDPECYILIETEINHSSFDKLECAIFNSKIADLNEIKAYQERFSKGFNRKNKKEKFTNMLKQLYNKNVIKSDISFEEKKEVPRINQNKETSIMENIEYLLQILKNQDINAYNTYNKEYEELLNNEDNSLTTKPFNLQNLTILETNIELAIKYKKGNATNILDYLNDLKEDYLYNFLTDNEEKTSLTFEEINQLNELFLKVKSQYKLTEQRNVLRSISLLFLMEIKENINNIDIDLLKQSYFIDSLKSIIIIIKSLQELNVIENDITINLNQELTTEAVIDIIKKIKFNKLSNESAKKMIKQI